MTDLPEPLVPPEVDAGCGACTVKRQGGGE